jgi:tetratricopeptide (TPR) repeat protein
MNSPRRNRARVLTASGLKKLRERIRSHEIEENAGYRYSLEWLGELTGLNSETVKNVLDCKGSDKGTLVRCFESFGLTLEESDYISAVQASATPSDPNFVGREGAIADLNALVSRNAKVIVIQARGGVGKTTLARKYLQQESGCFIEFPIAKETKDIASIEALIEEKLRQLGEEPGREFLVSLDRLKRKLQAERIGILIDNLEPALDSAGKFIEAHRRYVELLRVLSDLTVKSITLITSRERLREADVTVQHYLLKGLDVNAWEQSFQSRSINTETSALAALHNAHGGNAKAMDIISGAVLEDFSGDVEAYWQANQNNLFVERDLEDLVKKQFDRLQQLDPDAYNLLCRMGCYRYQDVSTVPIEGLFCLLWDVPENRHRRVIKSLQDRSLIEFGDGEFWLHPVIRKTTNYKSANYWTKNIQVIDHINDAIRAFEAYYHYLEIDDFEEAGLVLIRRRPTKSAEYWESGRNSVELGHSLYRLNLIRQVITATSNIINNITSKYCLGRLYFLLGVVHRLNGKVYQAIGFFQDAIDIAVEHLESLQSVAEQNASNYRMLKVNCLLDTVLCKIDLLEYDSALEILFSIIHGQDLKKVSEHTSTYKCVANSYLAFLKSCLKHQEESVEFTDSTYNEIKKNNALGGGGRLVFLGLAYKNSGFLSKALEVYSEALLHCKMLQYKTNEARVLVCIAEIHRARKEYALSIDILSQGIRLLDQVGAYPFLAEAYYQLGLTYQAVGEARKGQESFQNATRLFIEMEAPKQVERVKQSMQNLQ